MRTDVQMLSDADILTHTGIMQVRDNKASPFDVIYFESEDGSCLNAYLPLGWHNMMLEAIRKAYPPEPICAVCHSIHIPGTACDIHGDFIYSGGSRLESPVS